jgi:hypothetical protein
MELQSLNIGAAAHCHGDERPDCPILDELAAPKFTAHAKHDHDAAAKAPRPPAASQGDRASSPEAPKAGLFIWPHACEPPYTIPGECK